MSVAPPAANAASLPPSSAAGPGYASTNAPAEGGAGPSRSRDDQQIGQILAEVRRSSERGSRTCAMAREWGGWARALRRRRAALLFSVEVDSAGRLAASWARVLARCMRLMPRCTNIARSTCLAAMTGLETIANLLPSSALADVAAAAAGAAGERRSFRLLQLACRPVRFPAEYSVRPSSRSFCYSC